MLRLAWSTVPPSVSAAARGRGPALLVLLALSFGGGRARAAADPEEEAIRRGVELRRAGDDEGALRALQDAYAIKRSPRAACQVGFAEQALGRWADADTHVTECLRGEKDAWVIKNRDTINQAVGVIKGHIGRVEITGNVPGAAIAVAGKPVGKLPLDGPVKVSAGTVDVRAEAAGYRPAVREVKVGAGEYLRVVMTLDAEGAAGAAMAGDGTAASSDGHLLARNGPAADAAGAGRPLYRRPLFWGGVAAVVAAGVLTAVLLSGSTNDPRVDGQVAGN